MLSSNDSHASLIHNGAFSRPRCSRRRDQEHLGTLEDELLVAKDGGHLVAGEPVKRVRDATSEIVELIVEAIACFEAAFVLSMTTRVAVEAPWAAIHC